MHVYIGQILGLYSVFVTHKELLSHTLFLSIKISGDLGAANINEILRNDGETDMDEDHDAATFKLKFLWSEAQSFYSKIMLQKLKIGAFKTALLFCMLMFFGAFFAAQWLDIVSF